MWHPLISNAHNVRVKNKVLKCWLLNERKGKEIRLSIKGKNEPQPNPSVAIQYNSQAVIYMIILNLSVSLFDHTELIKNNVNLKNLGKIRWKVFIK